MTENGLYAKIPSAYVERLMAKRQVKKALSLCLYCAVKGQYKYDEMQIFWGVSKGCVAKWVKDFDEEIAKMEASHYFHNEQKTASNLHAKKEREQKMNEMETKNEQAEPLNMEAGEVQREQKMNEMETKNEHNNIKDKSKSIGANKFTPPTPEEISAFMQDRGVDSFTVDDFYLHYLSNGWKVGKVPMKSWKATVLKWHNQNQKPRVK